MLTRRPSVAQVGRYSTDLRQQVSNNPFQRHRQDLHRGPIQTAAHAPAVSDPSNEVPGRLLTTVLQHVKAAARPGAHRSPTLFSAVSTTTQSRRSEASQRRRCVAPERTRATLAGGSSGWPAELVRRRRSAASRYSAEPAKTMQTSSRTSPCAQNAGL